MPSEPVNSAATFGYLSTWDTPEHGCLGGYLVVSSLGRPLEFHCTAPIRPSRAQQILFGPTLWPFVMGEQIGGALIAEAKLRPQVILVDHAATLCLRPQVASAMVHWKASAGEGVGIDPSSAELLQVANSWFEVASDYISDRDVAHSLLTVLAQHVDLPEPFERIHQAIREAQRLGGPGEADAYDHAA
jgi:hypothetical protein